MSLSKLVAQHLGANPDTGYAAATLTRTTPGTRTPGNVTGGNNPTSVAYPCRARMGSRTSTSVVGAALVRTQVATVVILRDSLPAGVRPQVNDTVTRAGVVHTITDGSTTRGGSEVAYECAVRVLGG